MSTGHTPFFLCYGRHPKRPIATPADSATRVPAVLDQLRLLDTHIKEAHHNILKAQARQARNADSHRRHEEFKVRELVWLSSKNLKRQDVQCAKFASRWEGPFSITRVVGAVHVELKLPSHWTIFARFHVSDIKKYNSGYTSAFTGRGIPPPPPALDAEADTWEVEACLQKRHARGRKIEVLVSWVGWARCENRWLRYEWLNQAAKAEADLLPFNAPSRAVTRARASIPQESTVQPSPEQPTQALSQPAPQDASTARLPAPPPQPAPPHIAHQPTRRSTRKRIPTSR